MTNMEAFSALIVAATPVLLGAFGVLTLLIQVWTRSAVAALKRQTNSRMDQLLEVTSSAEYAKGILEEKARARERARTGRPTP